MARASYASLKIDRRSKSVVHICVAGWIISRLHMSPFTNVLLSTYRVRAARRLRFAGRAVQGAKIPLVEHAVQRRYLAEDEEFKHEDDRM